jgi:hypothetical protein
MSAAGPAIAYTSAAATADEALVPAHPMLKMVGYAVAESAASAAVAEVIIRHGTSASAPNLTPPINLIADGYGSFQCYVHCPDGVYIDRVGGNTTVTVYVRRD